MILFIIFKKITIYENYVSYFQVYKFLINLFIVLRDLNLALW